MGIIRRVLGRANQIAGADPAIELQVRVAPSIRRVRKLDERGAHANGVLTGIQLDLAGGETRCRYAVSLDDGERRIGIQFPMSRGSHRLRLGVPVVVKVDGDRGILDWAAMCDAWGFAGENWRQESIRKVPADGVVDEAVDSRTQRLLRDPARVAGTIERLDRVRVMGMDTVNWDVTIRTAEGATVRSERDEVPVYCWWYVEPGAAVSVAVDPKDATRARVDWPAFARARAGDVGFDDDPPAAGIAAQIEASWSAPAPSVAGTARIAPVDDAPPALDLSLSSWVDAHRGGHMTTKAFERAVSDWQQAGMCTPAQADLARRAAGL